MKLGLGSRRVHGLALGWIAAACAGLGCSLALDFEECRNDADCLTPEGLQLMCSADGECVTPVDPGAVTCMTNSDCVAEFGDEYVCGPTGGCAALLSGQCATAMHPEGVDPDNVVWIASMLPTSGYYESSFGVLQNAVQLAVEEFNDTTSLPGGRKIGWVACDTGGDPETAVTIAQHLVLTGMPAIIGPALSDELLEVAPITSAAGTFVISPTASAASITELADSGLVWRTIPSDAQQANAIGDWMPLLMPPPARPLILSKRGAYGEGLFAPVKERIEGVLSGEALASLLYKDPNTLGSQDDILADIALTISTGAQHNPDTIIILGDKDAADLMLFYLQDAWTDADPLPRFVFSHGGVPFMEAAVETVSAEFIDDLSANVTGVSPIIQDSANFDVYQTRYGIRFSGDPALTITALAYDATMVAELAIAAAGNGPVTGAAVAENVALLTDKSGEVVSFDEPALGFISHARDLVVEGTGVDLVGASGELDFDLATGEVRVDLLGWSLVPAGGTNATSTPFRQYVLDDAPSIEGTWIDL